MYTLWVFGKGDQGEYMRTFDGPWSLHKAQYDLLRGRSSLSNVSSFLDEVTAKLHQERVVELLPGFRQSCWLDQQQTAYSQAGYVRDIRAIAPLFEGLLKRQAVDENSVRRSVTDEVL